MLLGNFDPPSMARMGRKLLVVLLATSLACETAFASADDSFLRVPFKSYLFQSATDPAGVQELSRIIGKPVLLPLGVSDFVKEINGWNTGFRVPFWIRIGLNNETPTLRDVLAQTASSMGMKWSYEPKKDRVVLDFAWRRSDVRSGEELAHVLETTSASTSMQDLRYYWTQDALPPHDTWQIAFDALLSKAGATSNVWKVRLADDLKRGVPPRPVINMLSAKMKDQSGKEHLIIVNDQPLIVSPGEGTFSYYVFSLQGKFEQGGLFGSGWRCEDPSAWVEGGETQLTFRGFFNKFSKMDQHFTLDEKGLVLRDVLDDHGATTAAPGEGLIENMHMGKSLLHVP
jgi:hypothetical protein